MRTANGLAKIEASLTENGRARDVLVERGTGYLATVEISRLTPRQYTVAATRDDYSGEATFPVAHTEEALAIAIGAAYAELERQFTEDALAQLDEDAEEREARRETKRIERERQRRQKAFQQIELPAPSPVNSYFPAPEKELSQRQQEDLRGYRAEVEAASGQERETSSVGRTEIGAYWNKSYGCDTPDTCGVCSPERERFIRERLKEGLAADADNRACLVDGNANCSSAYSVNCFVTRDFYDLLQASKAEPAPEEEDEDEEEDDEDAPTQQFETGSRVRSLQGKALGAAEYRLEEGSEGTVKEFDAGDNTYLVNFDEANSLWVQADEIEQVEEPQPGSATKFSKGTRVYSTTGKIPGVADTPVGTKGTVIDVGDEGGRQVYIVAFDTVGIGLWVYEDDLEAVPNPDKRGCGDEICVLCGDPVRAAEFERMLGGRRFA